ncbi:MAG TPA: hypothetical protein VM536_08300 [Chloroflexia bacterium]|nr:hypothetical protein [Chloroflexia bacterium]
MKRAGLLLALAALLVALAPFGGTRAAGEVLTLPLTAQNGSGQDGTVTITSLNAETVRVEIKLNKPSTVAQPAHIHEGSCATLNPAPAYPLNSVVNGASTTEVKADIERLASKGYAVNIHKSAAEASVYVACADIHETEVSGTFGGDPWANLQTAAHVLVRETTNKDETGANAAYTAYHDLFAANEDAIKAKSAETQAKLEDLMHEVRDAITAKDWTKAASAATQLETAVKEAVTMMGSTAAPTPSGVSMSAMQKLDAAAGDLKRETANNDKPGSDAAYTAYHDLFAANEDAIKAKSAETQAKLEDLMHEVRDALAANDMTKAAAAASKLEEAVGTAVTMMGSAGSTPGVPSTGNTSGGTTLPTSGNGEMPALLLILGAAALALGALGVTLRRHEAR